MESVTLSSSYRIVIPKSVRAALNLAPGQRLRVFAYGDRIECVPERPISELRGFLPGLDTRVERDGDRV